MVGKNAWNVQGEPIDSCPSPDRTTHGVGACGSLPNWSHHNAGVLCCTSSATPFVDRFDSPISAPLGTKESSAYL